MHIIVCSRDSTIAESVVAAFGSKDPHVTVCESGLEVLGAVGLVEADLLILDMQTAGLNGMLITSAVRELSPSLPVLAMRAKPEEAKILSQRGVSCIPAGAADSLPETLALFCESSGTGTASVGSSVARHPERGQVQPC